MASGDSLLTSLNAGRQTPQVPMNYGGQNPMNNSINQTSLANVNLQNRQSTTSIQDDTRLMNTMSAVEGMSRNITNAINSQTQQLMQGFGGIAQAISQGFQGVGQLLQQLFSDRMTIAAQQDQASQLLKEYNDYFSNFFRTFFEKKYNSLVTDISHGFSSFEDVKQTMIKYIGQNETLAKILEVTPYHHLKNPKELAPFTKDIADAITSSSKYLNQMSIYQQQSVENYWPIHLDTQSKIHESSLNSVKFAKDQVQYLSNIYGVLSKIYTKQYSPEALENKKNEINKTKTSINELRVKEKNGSLTETESRKLSLLQKQLSNQVSDARFLRDAINSKGPNLRNVDYSSQAKELTSSMDTLGKIMREQIKAIDSNTEEIKKEVSFSNVLMDVGKSLINPLTWVKVLTGPLGKLGMYLGLYKVLDKGIQWAKPRISSLGNVQVPITRENGTSHTVGSLLTSGYDKLKTYIIDPLLSGLKSVFKWVLGDEWFTKISDSFISIKTYTKDIFTAMFGDKADREAARTKLGNMIHEGLTTAIEKSLPIVLKGVMLYRGFKALANPLQSWRTVKDGLFGRLANGSTRSSTKDVLAGIEESYTQNVINENYDPSTIVKKGKNYYQVSSRGGILGQLGLTKKTKLNIPKMSESQRKASFMRSKGFESYDGEYYIKNDDGSMRLSGEFTGSELERLQNAEAQYKLGTQSFKSTPIGQRMVAAKEAVYSVPIVGKAAQGVGAVGSFVGQAVGKVGSALGSTFGFLSKIVGKVGTAFKTLLGPIGIIISVFSALSWIRDIVKKFNNEKGGVESGIGKFIGKFIGDAVKNVGEVVYTAVTGLPDILAGTMKGLWGFIWKEGPKLIKNSIGFLLVDLPIAFIKVITYPFKWIWNVFKKWWDDKDKQQKKDRETVGNKLGVSGKETGWFEGLAIRAANSLGFSEYRNTDADRAYNFARQIVFDRLSQHDNVESLIKSGYISHLDLVAKQTEESDLQDSYQRISDTLKNIVETYKKDQAEGNKLFSKFLTETQKLNETQVLITSDFREYMDGIYKGLSSNIAQQNLSEEQIRQIYIQKAREQMDVLDPNYVENLKHIKDEENKLILDKIQETANKQQEQIDKGAASLGQIATWFKSGAAKKFIKDSITSLGDQIKAGWEFLKNQDYKKMFGDAMEVFGGVSGNIINTIFGEDKANSWIDNALKYAEANNKTYAKRFLMGAKNSLADNVKQIAENTAQIAQNTDINNAVQKGGASLGGLTGGASSGNSGSSSTSYGRFSSEEYKKYLDSNKSLSSDKLKNVVSGIDGYALSKDKAAIKLNKYKEAVAGTDKGWASGARGRLLNLLKKTNISMYDNSGNVNTPKTVSDMIMVGSNMTKTVEGTGTNRNDGQLGWSRVGIYAVKLPLYYNDMGPSMKKLMQTEYYDKFYGGKVHTKQEATTGPKAEALKAILNGGLGKTDQDPRFANVFINDAKLHAKVFERYFNPFKDIPFPVNVLLADHAYQYGFGDTSGKGGAGFISTITRAARALGAKGISNLDKTNALKALKLNAEKNPWYTGSVLLSSMFKRSITNKVENIVGIAARVKKLAGMLGYIRDGEVFNHPYIEKAPISSDSNNEANNQSQKPTPTPEPAKSDNTNQKPVPGPIESNNTDQKPIAKDTPIVASTVKEPKKLPVPDTLPTKNNSKVGIKTSQDQPVSEMVKNNDTNLGKDIKSIATSRFGDKFKQAYTDFISNHKKYEAAQQKAKSSAIEDVTKLYNAESFTGNVYMDRNFNPELKFNKNYQDILNKLKAKKITAEKAKSFLTDKELDANSQGDLKEYIAILTELMKTFTTTYGETDKRTVQLTNVITQLSQRQNTSVQQQQGKIGNFANRYSGKAKAESKR